MRGYGGENPDIQESAMDKLSNAIKEFQSYRGMKNPKVKKGDRVKIVAGEEGSVGYVGRVTIFRRDGSIMVRVKSKWGHHHHPATAKTFRVTEWRRIDEDTSIPGRVELPGHDVRDGAGDENRGSEDPSERREERAADRPPEIPEGRSSADCSQSEEKGE